MDAEALTNSGVVSGKVIFRDTKNGKSRAAPFNLKVQEQILAQGDFLAPVDQRLGQPINCVDFLHRNS